MRTRSFLLCLALILAGLTAVYWNHFDNAFQFDDDHTIQGNAFIRDLGNLPRYFVDARTFSNLPSNQSYRPLLTATLAIDYAIAGGYNVFYFHLTSYLLFLLQIVLMAWLFRALLSLTQISALARDWLTLISCSFYAFHPAIAETVNYIIQRGDILSTLGVVAGFALYLGLPNLKRWGLYLIPVALGALAKPPALMFAPLLSIYLLLFETKASIFSSRAFKDVAAKSLPAWLVCAGLFYLQHVMTPETFVPGGQSRWLYLITQPWVLLYYLRALFLPTHLSADYDWGTFTSISDPKVWLGLVGNIILIGFAFWCLKFPNKKLIAFGIFWFYISLLPTSSIIPLSEVLNDHRLFFPYVGLCLASVYSLYLLVAWLRNLAGPLWAIGFSLLLCASLPLYAWGAYSRNQVWHSEESLWLDVTIKSPGNGRGLMNYGLTQMSQGNYARALEYFERAQVFNPYYATLQINLAIAKSGLGRIAEAEKHFLKAISLSPGATRPYFYYGRWLRDQGRLTDAMFQFELALKKYNLDLDSRHLLLETYADLGRVEELKRLSEDTLVLFPGDETAIRHLNSIPSLEARQGEAKVSEPGETPESLVQQSLLYHRAGEFESSLAAAEAALKLRPNYAIAYNNICSAYNELGKPQLAIPACQQALALDPNFKLAQGNLDYARSLLAEPK